MQRTVDNPRAPARAACSDSSTARATIIVHRKNGIASWARPRAVRPSPFTLASQTPRLTPNGRLDVNAGAKAAFRDESTGALGSNREFAWTAEVCGHRRSDHALARRRRAAGVRGWEDPICWMRCPTKARIAPAVGQFAPGGGRCSRLLRNPDPMRSRSAPSASFRSRERQRAVNSGG
jgi:hypothetical protein